MNDFKVTLNGTALLIELGRSLNTTNAPALQEELTKYVFVNCAKEIYHTLKLIGLASSIKFMNIESKKVIRKQDSLDEFTANNDVVCYSMRLGQDDE